MFSIIKGDITLIQYFMSMIISTICLIGVVAGAYFLPHNKDLVATTVMILSVVSLMSSGRIISLTLHKDEY